MEDRIQKHDDALTSTETYMIKKKWSKPGLIKMDEHRGMGAEGKFFSPGEGGPYGPS